jgi:protein-tyrosine phosphatase
MIDLHLHLLPGVDDGPSTIDGSREMLEYAAHAGFQTLIATPHLKRPLDRNYESIVLRELDQVRVAAEARGIYVGQGYEIMLQPGVPDQLARGDSLSLDESSTLLVELPFDFWPPFVDETIFSLQSMGYTILLAHPERYTMAQRNPELVLALANRGVLLQVTFASLAGVFGKQCQRLAESLLTNDLVAVLASDAHSVGYRFTSVEAGMARARQVVGEQRVTQLVVANPVALLEDRPLPAPALIVPQPNQPGLLSTIRSWSKRS